jgi:hypothetical protein
MALKKLKTKEKNMKRLIAAVVLVGIVLTSTASATLGTVDIEGHNNSLSDTGHLWGGTLTNLYAYTGIYSWDKVEGTGSTPLAEAVPDWGFCIELTQGAHNGVADVIYLEEAPRPPSVYGTPMGTTKADYIRELWGRFFDPNWVIGPITDNERKLGEAFGAAVWEIIYETDSTWDVSNHTGPGTGFKASNIIEQAATANYWLSQLIVNPAPAQRADDLYAISNGTGQDYIVQLPEPATICLLGLGALSLLRRKR